LPGFSTASSWPSADVFQAAATNPMQFWMQFAEQWQKATAEAMAFWSKGGKASDTTGRSRR
jgi:hypothetical protein